MRKSHTYLLLIPLLLQCAIAPLQAKNVYQEPDEFIAEVFEGEEVEKKRLWIKKDLKPRIREIMGHDLPQLRVRYWQQANRTAWILEEIGKYEPITMGFVVNDGFIEMTRVLIFRESRGWEIRYPFFTDQYKKTSLKENLELSRHIDGISGATLSVSAVNRLAKLALYLHSVSDAAIPE